VQLGSPLFSFFFLAPSSFTGGGNKKTFFLMGRMTP
jgi:hypothetical protein